MIRFEKFLEAVLDDAAREARADGSSTVEAQHLLLAIADSDEPSTRRVLASVGLDRAAIRAALDREFDQSLGAAGVSLGDSGVPRPSQAHEGSPQLSSSFRLAMERGIGSARTSAPQPLHLLLGIVQAPVGTVPRALALAGVDREDLLKQIHESLSSDADTVPGRASR
jgi:ATP-dependent Clp protease ATP-binding subunit ClpA